MTFLAPWALAIAGSGATAMVLLHLVAQHRPAAFFLPTTRFIPDTRTVVSRAATRPRDLVLLALRVLLILAAGAAFARPVLVPTRGAMARIILLDRSSSVASTDEVLARVRAVTVTAAPSTIIAFDSVPALVLPSALDSIHSAGHPTAPGSMSAALIAARRAAVLLADRADSVQLFVVSPLAISEFDSATLRIRAGWPGSIRIERVALRANVDSGWRLERPLPMDDPLGPASRQIGSVRGARVTRLVRQPPIATDSAYARSGGTVVWWDSASASRPTPDGLSADGRVIVAALGRRVVAARGRVRARWSDGTVAAVDTPVGAGCIREVGVALPATGDLALHAPFQDVARTLLAPCGTSQGDAAADSVVIARLSGTGGQAAPADRLRAAEDRPSPLAPWLLAFAILLAIAELMVRARTEPKPA
ncbi:MAG: BatA domain-containing protein [bacterium]